MSEDEDWFVVWCPVCDESANLQGRDAAVGLKINHDENHHDGQAQAFVSVLKEGEDG